MSLLSLGFQEFSKATYSRLIGLLLREVLIVIVGFMGLIGARLSDDQGASRRSGLTFLICLILLIWLITDWIGLHIHW